MIRTREVMQALSNRIQVHSYLVLILKYIFEVQVNVLVLAKCILHLRISSKKVQKY